MITVSLDPENREKTAEMLPMVRKQEEAACHNTIDFYSRPSR
jgi:hypothetical protein